ncbi:MAG: thioredoxin family protein [Flavobacteriales bacterium]|nr:thioredoxin family protein [Flavobacteriales bacterium]MCX7768739.1 thioredoxin family protein [Flavobacteriales bacterium]MDW8409899.1 thioredoxin family protein [Flavobacteriales bacterium]
MGVISANDSNFSELLRLHPQVIVKFFASWCGTCRLIGPKFARLSEDPRFAGIKFLEVDAEYNPEARHTAGVDNLPYFAIFKNGQLIRGEATGKEEGILSLLNDLTA